MTESTHMQIEVPADVSMSDVVGPADSLLHRIEDAFEARIVVRGNVISAEGDAAEMQTLTKLLSEIVKHVQDGETFDEAYLKRALELLKTSELCPSALRNDVLLTYRGRSIHPKTAGQKHYIDAIRRNTITFGVGPAGTGKTYLAMACALASIKRKEVGRIVLTRPVVEAGENLGFLPGSLSEKVDPYVRPLYDALFDMMDNDKALQLIEDGVIEIAPLAFMRGRTLNDAFIILDEAQNTTPEQMKMFLTRLGLSSKMVITGDPTQLDLPHGVSGLKGAREILEGIDGIEFCRLSGKDVVRHSLVSAIVAAYDKHSK